MRIIVAIELRSASLINGSDEQCTRCCHIIARRESLSWNNYNELEASPLILTHFVVIS